jgi:hypothetical protein
MHCRRKTLEHALFGYLCPSCQSMIASVEFSSEMRFNRLCEGIQLNWLLVAASAGYSSARDETNDFCRERFKPVENKVCCLPMLFVELRPLRRILVFALRPRESLIGEICAIVERLFDCIPYCLQVTAFSHSTSSGTTPTQPC